jgi:hypothetical protein
MALTGLWDSMFSRKYPTLWQRWPRRFWPKIGLRVGTPVDPTNADVTELRERVAQLRGADK